MTSSANVLNNDLLQINNWSYQWKMKFNPDSSPGWLFSLKIDKPSHPDLIFDGNQVTQTPYQKHVRMFLDDKLNFGDYFKYIANRFNKSIGLLRKLQKLLPRRSLFTIYKSFIRPHIDVRIKETYFTFQYNTSLTITSLIRGTSKEKLYQELGFESLQHSFVNSPLFIRFLKINLPVIFMSYYLLKPTFTTQYHLSIYPFFILNTIFLKIYFFLLW